MACQYSDLVPYAETTFRSRKIFLIFLDLKVASRALEPDHAVTALVGLESEVLTLPILPRKDGWSPPMET
jgi:hypothetical protein